MNTIGRADAAGLTKAQRPIQTVALIAVSIVAVWTLYMVPSWQAPGDPFLLAAVAGAVTVACLWLTRWLGTRALKFELTWLAIFLVGMPLIFKEVGLVPGHRNRSPWIGMGFMAL